MCVALSVSIFITILFFWCPKVFFFEWIVKKKRKNRGQVKNDYNLKFFRYGHSEMERYATRADRTSKVVSECCSSAGFRVAQRPLAASPRRVFIDADSPLNISAMARGKKVDLIESSQKVPMPIWLQWFRYDRVWGYGGGGGVKSYSLPERIQLALLRRDRTLIGLLFPEVAFCTLRRLIVQRDALRSDLTRVRRPLPFKAL